MTKPTRADAERAIETLLTWIGEDPLRDGLRSTPRRVIDAFAEFFSGYEENPVTLLERSFENINQYEDMVLVKDIELFSHCEHHMVPILGVAHVAYFPTNRVVGISKLARTVDVFARRLQTQEFMTKAIADAIQTALEPLGVAVYIDAKHMCMTSRGVKKHFSSTVTTHFSGLFADNEHKNIFLQAIRKTENLTF